MHIVVIALFALPGMLVAQKPSDGKVLIHVKAGEAKAYKEVQQTISDLEDSARHLRRFLGRSDWIELTDKEEGSDIRITILGRRRDPDKGNALGYFLDAGGYKTEDETVFEGELDDTGGGASPDVRSTADGTADRSVVDFEDLARMFAGSLDEFCQANYERLIAQRK